MKECNLLKDHNMKSWTMDILVISGIFIINNGIYHFFCFKFKINSTYYSVYYDLFSIMHYSSQGGLLEARDQRRSFLMGQRFTLSFSDIKMANKAYNCDGLFAFTI